jgi:hypothetical protein
MSDVTNSTTTDTVTEVVQVATEVAEAAPLVAEVVASPQTTIESILGDWLNNHVRNSPIAQNTAAWNHLTSTALPALVGMLVKGL